MITYYYPPPLNKIILVLGQFVAMCRKPKHLKHLVFEVLVENLGLEV